MNTNYLDATPESAVALFGRDLPGTVVMLNLLQLKVVADYSANPELADKRPISGREAFDKYIEHTLPFLEGSGGKLSFLGEGGHFFIGPQDERWDLVMLVQQNSLTDFLAFASNEAYMAGLGHRTAAVQDSRPLPLEECDNQHRQIG